MIKCFVYKFTGEGANLSLSFSLSFCLSLQHCLFSLCSQGRGLFLIARCSAMWSLPMCVTKKATFRQKVRFYCRLLCTGLDRTASTPRVMTIHAGYKEYQYWRLKALDHLPVPHFTLYLDASPQCCHERIHSRGRVSAME